MSFLTPLAFIGAIIALPIILLYMLRLRRREVVVSSNFLWQQIVHDHEANTPWQRLRRNLLLFLQLLIVALLVLALARPAQIVPSISAGRSVILLDATASMNATDSDNGSTRWQRAQNAALELIANMSSQDEMSLIRVGDIAEPLTGYTNDAAALRTAVLNADVGQGVGDWDTALTLAVAGAQGADAFNIIIISDGNLGERIAQLPETVDEPILISIGEAGDNLAISALAARAPINDVPQLFAQVTNYGAADAQVSLVVRLDGELWQSSTQTIAANSQRSFVFAVDVPFTTASAELVYDDTVRDFLALDDAAWTVATDQRTRRVLLLAEGGNSFLSQALASIAGVQTFRGDTARRDLPQQAYDLYVFDGYLPDTLPDGDMLIINPPPNVPQNLFRVGETVSDAGAWRIRDDAHPLTAFLNVDAVNLRQYQRLDADWGAALITVDVPNTADANTLLLAGERDGRQIAVLPFDLRASDLPLQLAFPILMANLIEWYSPANVIDNTRPFTVGATIPVRPPIDANRLRLTQPDNTTRNLPIEAASLILTDTHQVGLYGLEVLDGNDVLQQLPFAVTLFGSDESAIAPHQRLTIGGAASDDGADEPLGWREYWAWLALAALLLLLLEWRVYYRRLRAPRLAQVGISRTTARR